MKLAKLLSEKFLLHSSGIGGTAIHVEASARSTRWNCRTGFSVQGKGFHMAVYRTQDHHNDDNGNDNSDTKVSQRGRGNRSSNRSNNRITNINILGLGGRR